MINILSQGRYHRFWLDKVNSICVFVQYFLIYLIRILTTFVYNVSVFQTLIHDQLAQARQIIEAIFSETSKCTLLSYWFKSWICEKKYSNSFILVNVFPQSEKTFESVNIKLVVMLRHVRFEIYIIDITVFLETVVFY